MKKQMMSFAAAGVLAGLLLAGCGGAGSSSVSEAQSASQNSSQSASGAAQSVVASESQLSESAAQAILEQEQSRADEVLAPIIEAAMSEQELLLEELELQGKATLEIIQIEQYGYEYRFTVTDTALAGNIAALEAKAEAMRETAQAKFQELKNKGFDAVMVYVTFCNQKGDVLHGLYLE